MICLRFSLSCFIKFDSFQLTPEVLAFGPGGVEEDILRQNIRAINSGFYNGLTIHRSQPGFVIQGGDPKNGGKSETPSIKGEFASNGHYGNNIQHVRGVISMARTNDPNSASSQFFICLGDCRSSLDGSYAGFGYVVEGMDVVDKIAEFMAPYGDPSLGMVTDKNYQVKITSAVVLENYK